MNVVLVDYTSVLVYRAALKSKLGRVSPSNLAFAEAKAPAATLEINAARYNPLLSNRAGAEKEALAHAEFGPVACLHSIGEYRIEKGY